MHYTLIIQEAEEEVRENIKEAVKMVISARMESAPDELKKSGIHSKDRAAGIMTASRWED